MDTFQNVTEYFSNFDYIKYGAILSLIWLFLSYSLKQEYNLNFIIRIILFIAIVYYLFSKNFSKKKLTEGNIKNKLKQLYDYGNEQNIQKLYIKLDLTYLEKDDNLILLFADNLELRKINLEAFNNSLQQCNDFLKYYHSIMEKENINYKQYEDNLILTKQNCLNQLASINVSIETKEYHNMYSNNTSKLEYKLETMLDNLNYILENYNLKIQSFLQKKFYNTELNSKSHPKHYLDNEVSGDITNTKTYSENYTIYY